MISTILFSTLSFVSAAPTSPALPVAVVQDDAEFEKRKAEAGEDVDKLWAVHEWCKENGRSRDSEAILEQIVKLQPDHEEAHKALGHRFYDGKWFDGPVELSKYKRALEKRMLEEKGLVRFKNEWVPQDDVPFLRMGWTKGDDGEWVSPTALERKAREAKYAEEGWQQQDLVWVSPDDFDKWRAELWKCGDEWLSLEEADKYHAKLGQGWRLPGEHFIVESTCDRESTRWAWWYADQTYADLVRAYGKKPERKPELYVCRSLGQYNTLAAGDGQSQPPVEQSGHSSIHYAFFADAWIGGTPQAPEFRGIGVCYWDVNDPNLKPWGQHAIRHAAAQSYAEAIDPSWDMISRAATGGFDSFSLDGFWAEKDVPRWFRYGVAAYCERFFKDGSAQSGKEWWARDWSLDSLRQKGGMRPLKDIFAFTIDGGDPEGSGKLMLEAGALLSFVLDGGCPPVTQAHQAFKAALRGEGDPKAAIQALEEAIVANEAKLKEYTGL